MGLNLSTVLGFFTYFYLFNTCQVGTQGRIHEYIFDHCDVSITHLKGPFLTVNELKIRNRKSYEKENFCTQAVKNVGFRAAHVPWNTQNLFIKKQNLILLLFNSTHASHNNDSIVSAVSITDTPNNFS